MNNLYQTPNILQISPIHPKKSSFQQISTEESFSVFNRLRNSHLQIHQQKKIVTIEKSKFIKNTTNIRAPKSKTQKMMQILSKIYLKKIRFPMQLIKQYILFDESDNSIIVINNYQQENIIQGIDTLVSTLNLFLQTRKVFAFTRIKLLVKNNLFCSQSSYQKYCNKQSMQKILSILKKIQIKRSFQSIYDFSQVKKSKAKQVQLNAHNTKQTTETSQGYETLKKSKKNTQNLQYNNLKNTSQTIYLINTVRSNQMSKTSYIKIPMQSNRIVIKEINVMNNQSQSLNKISRSTIIGKSSSSHRHVQNENICNKKKHDCCKYCQLFENLYKQQNKNKKSSINQYKQYRKQQSVKRRIYI